MHFNPNPALFAPPLASPPVLNHVRVPIKHLVRGARLSPFPGHVSEGSGNVFLHQEQTWTCITRIRLSVRGRVDDEAEMLDFPSGCSHLIFSRSTDGRHTASQDTRFPDCSLTTNILNEWLRLLGLWAKSFQGHPSTWRSAEVEHSSKLLDVLFMQEKGPRSALRLSRQCDDWNDLKKLIKLVAESSTKRKFAARLKAARESTLSRSAMEQCLMRNMLLPMKSKLLSLSIENLKNLTSKFSPSSKHVKKRERLARTLLHSRYRSLSKDEIRKELNNLFSSVVLHSPRNRELRAISTDVKYFFRTRREQLRVIEFYHFTMK
eukprot:764395-Hanusia_phi.AAC.1